MKGYTPLLIICAMLFAGTASATGKTKDCAPGHNKMGSCNGDIEVDSSSRSNADSSSISEGGTAIIEGSTDNSIRSYRYEEAAASAAILWGQVCQDTTNLQGVAFGIGSQKQSLFCQRLSLAQGYFSAAMMTDCGERESLAKGAQPVPSPTPTQCERDKRASYLDGLTEMDKARNMLDGQKDGFLKKVWNFIW